MPMQLWRLLKVGDPIMVFDGPAGQGIAYYAARPNGASVRPAGHVYTVPQPRRQDALITVRMCDGRSPCRTCRPKCRMCQCQTARRLPLPAPAFAFCYPPPLPGWRPTSLPSGCVWGLRPIPATHATSAKPQIRGSQAINHVCASGQAHVAPHHPAACPSYQCNATHPLLVSATPNIIAPVCN